MHRSRSPAMRSESSRSVPPIAPILHTPRATRMARTGSSRWILLAASQRGTGGAVRTHGLSNDESTRRFRFRNLAQVQLARATAEEQSIIAAYARGVNAGVASLRSRPWEYWILRMRPSPWRPEDTLLATDAMWWDLQSEAFEREKLRQQDQRAPRRSRVRGRMEVRAGLSLSSAHAMGRSG